MRDKYLKVLMFITVIAILIVVNTTQCKNVIRVTVLDVSHTVMTSAHFLFYNFASGIYKLTDFVQVYREREQLNREISDLRFKLIQYDESKEENKRLRLLLNFQEKNELQGISAQVIGRDMSPFSDYIVINRGKSDYVDIGMVLISHEGLVGHIISAGMNHARAMLVGDMKARVCAIVQDTREAGIIEGTPTNLLKLRHLNIASTVKVGDTIITSGFGDIYPKGIPIGRVEMIATEKNNLSLYALIRPFVDFSKLEEVLCLKKG